MLKRWGHEDGFCRFLLVKVHPPQPQRHSHNLGFVVIVWLTSSSSSFVVALLRCCVVASLRRCRSVMWCGRRLLSVFVDAADAALVRRSAMSRVKLLLLSSSS